MGFFNLSDYSLRDQIYDMMDSYVYADEDLIVKCRYSDGKTDIYVREDNDKGHNSYSGWFRDGFLDVEPHPTNSDYNSRNDDDDDDDDNRTYFNFF